MLKQTTIICDNNIPHRKNSSAYKIATYFTAYIEKKILYFQYIIKYFYTIITN